MEEIVWVQKIKPEDLPNSELKVDVLLGTDSSGSHKQFAGKDIEVDSRNLEYGKQLEKKYGRFFNHCLFCASCLKPEVLNIYICLQKCTYMH